MAAWSLALRSGYVPASRGWDAHREAAWEGRHDRSCQRPFHLPDNPRSSVSMCRCFDLVLVLRPAALAHWVSQRIYCPCMILTGAAPPASTPPVQSHRPAQRMLPRTLQSSLLQREIPLRRLIRIIDQHQPGIESQPLRLLNHGLLILSHKPPPKECSNWSYKWNPIKDIPSRAHINPRSRSRNGRHCRQTRKPFLPRANRLIPPVRQHKIDRRCDRFAINAQQLIRRRVRARCMRRHAKPRIPAAIPIIIERLKVLRLLVNARLASPPPRLMDKRPMRRIHQPDNPVIHIARQLRRQMSRPKPARELRHLRHRRQISGTPPNPRLRQENPRIPIPLLTRKCPRKNLGRVQRLKARQRRNLLALSRTRLEPPPMILTSHRLPIEPSRRQRNPPMWTQIPHREDLPVLLSSQKQWHAQQQSLRSLLSA